MTFEKNLEIAFVRAIEAFGESRFKSLSMFGSNERKHGIIDERRAA